MPKAFTGLTFRTGMKRVEDPGLYMRVYRRYKQQEVNAKARARYAERYANEPEYRQRKRDQQRWARRMKKYGVTKEWYMQAIKDQVGRCKVCNEYKGMELRVDHCHSTKMVRGLLCDSCNQGLGKFKDNPKALRNAALYLEGNPLICHGNLMLQPVSTGTMP